MLKILIHVKFIFISLFYIINKIHDNNFIKLLDKTVNK